MHQPGEEKWLIEIVVDADDEIIIRDRLDLRSREHSIDQNPLQKVFTKTPSIKSKISEEKSWIDDGY